MKDFILTLVVVFVIFKVISSFRSVGQRSNPPERKDDRPGFNKDGTRVEYRNDADEGEYTDYEIIDEKKKKDEDPS